MRKQRFKAGFSNLVLFLTKSYFTSFTRTISNSPQLPLPICFSNYNNNNSVQPQLTSPSLNRFRSGRVWDRDRSASDLLGSTLQETAESGRGDSRERMKGLLKDVVSARGQLRSDPARHSQACCARHVPPWGKGPSLSSTVLDYYHSRFPLVQIISLSFGGFHSAKGNFLDKRQLWLSNQHSQQLWEEEGHAQHGKGIWAGDWCSYFILKAYLKAGTSSRIPTPCHMFVFFLTKISESADSPWPYLRMKMDWWMKREEGEEREIQCTFWISYLEHK